MLQALRKNFGLKLFSLALAVSGWAYFRFLAGPALPTPFERLGVPIAAAPSVQRTFAVDLAYTGDTGSFRVGNVDIQPRTVTLSGSAGDLARVRAVRVEVQIPATAGTYDAMVRPQIVAPGIAPAPIEISPNMIRVRVGFERPGA